jgi:ATP-dependent HslUV protease ATP-binding subunit HslU
LCHLSCCLVLQDLYRILTEPETNMIRQQQLLMKTEDINLIFTDDAIEELAIVAAEVQFFANGFNEVE